MAKSFYNITEELRGQLLKRDISDTVKALGKKDISGNAMMLILSVLVQEYSMRINIKTSIIRRYLKNECCKTDSSSLVAIGKILAEFNKPNYDKAIALLERLLVNKSPAYAKTTIERVKEFDLEILPFDTITKLDYTKPILAQLERESSPIKIKCSLCEQEKNRSEFRRSYSYCEDCRKKHSKDKGNQRKSLNKLIVDKAATLIRK